MNKSLKLLLALLMTPALMLGIKNNAHEVNAEEVVKTRATFITGTSAGMREAVFAAFGEDRTITAIEELRNTHWGRIVSFTVTNDINDVPEKSKWLVDPVEAGQLTGTTKQTTL